MKEQEQMTIAIAKLNVAAFKGGPMDGQIMQFPSDTPPGHVAAGGVLYQRQVSPADDGPIWLFVPAEP